MKKTQLSFVFVLFGGLVMLLILNNCSSTQTAIPPISPSATPTQKAITNQKTTQIPTVTRQPTATSEPITYQPTQNETHPPTSTQKPIKATPTTIPFATVTFLGTPVPSPLGEIDKSNLSKLERVAQWGKGNIIDLAFSPDGQFLVAGSTHGYAVYSTRNLEAPPRWVPFEPPFMYEQILFNEGGRFLYFYKSGSGQIRDFITGEVVKEFFKTEWLKTTALSDSWGEMSAVSLDGKVRFSSYVTHDEEFWDIEFSNREIFDAQSGELITQLKDETFYVEYSDANEPQGCDLPSFGYCGNAYSPNTFHPFRVGFSPAGKTLAVLYRAPNLGNSSRFSILRIYQVSSGKLLHVIGSFQKPVVSFSFVPDGKTIAVGFTDGTVQLVDIAAGQVVFNAQHFNQVILGVTYTFDGDYLLIQRPGILEVRTPKDGSLKSRFEAAAFALSPNENLLAIGGKDGELVLIDLDTGQTRFRIEAHTQKIFALAFSLDGEILTSSGEDCAVRSWDANSGRFLHYFQENTTNAYGEESTASRIFIKFLKYLPGTEQLIGFGSWSRVVSWNANSGATQYLIEPEPLDYYQGMVTLNPHFPEFIGVDLENQVFHIDNIVYDIETGEKKGTIAPIRTPPAGCAATGPVSGDGSLIFTRGYDDLEGQICLMSNDIFELLGTINVIPKSLTNNVWIDWLFLSPKGDQLIITLSSGAIDVFQPVP